MSIQLTSAGRIPRGTCGSGPWVPPRHAGEVAGACERMPAPSRHEVPMHSPRWHMLHLTSEYSLGPSPKYQNTRPPASPRGLPCCEAASITMTATSSGCSQGKVHTKRALGFHLSATSLYLVVSTYAAMRSRTALSLSHFATQRACRMDTCGKSQVTHWPSPTTRSRAPCLACRWEVVVLNTRWPRM